MQIVSETYIHADIDEQSLKNIILLANNADKNAIAQPGVFYESGYNFNAESTNLIVYIPKNMDSAVQLYKLSDYYGSMKCCHQLGEIYYHGVMLKKHRFS